METEKKKVIARTIPIDFQVRQSSVATFVFHSSTLHFLLWFFGKRRVNCEWSTKLLIMFTFKNKLTFWVFFCFSTFSNDCFRIRAWFVLSFWIRSSQHFMRAVLKSVGFIISNLKLFIGLVNWISFEFSRHIAATIAYGWRHYAEIYEYYERS